MPKVLKFQPRMTTSRKQRIIAVANAAVEVKGFESGNVSAEIVAWLRKDGYEVAGKDGTTKNAGSIVTEDMHYLNDHGYAAMVVNGKRVVEFWMDPDVKVPTPDYKVAKGYRNPPPAPVPATPTIRVLPPLPPRPAPTPDLKDLNSLVTQWWHQDREAAEAWISGSCEVLTDLIES